MKGIDVSSHQGRIDWNAVKAAGIEFVVIRGGYGNDISQKDKRFDENMQGALAAGLHVGAYWFSYAFNADMAKQEAAIFLQVMELYKGRADFPLCFDWEYDSDKYARKNGVAADSRLITDMAAAFLEALEGAGWYAMNYTNQDYYKNKFDGGRMKPYDLWLADYTGGSEYFCGMQQTGSTGRVAGITGNVDTDTAFKDYPSIIRAAELNGFKTATAAPVAPKLAPAPAKSAPTTYTVNRQLYGYLTAADAAARRNVRGTVEPGTYSIYNTASGMINVTRAKGQPGSWINPADNTGAAAPAPAEKPVMREGATVQYSGPLYADSYGGGKGKTVSGTYKVDIYKPDRPYGVHLPAGWVPESICKVVG